MEQVIHAVRTFFEYLGATYAQDGLYTLIESCKHDPKALEELSSKLTEFSNLEPLASHRNAGISIKGLFHKNGLILTGINIDNHFSGTPEEIDPLTLRDVYNNLSQTQRDATNALAYTGLRPTQLFNTRLDQIQPINEEYYILDYSKGADRLQVKTRLAHYGFCPKNKLDPLIQRAKENGQTVICHDWTKILKDITDFARLQFKTHLTAKYWRQRFKTIAEHNNIPANIFNWLDGSTPNTGANALNYAQNNKLRFLRIYDQLLNPHLNPNSEETTTTQAPEQTGASKEQLDRIETKLDKLLANK